METLYSKNADRRQKIEVAFQEHYQTYNISLYDINWVFLTNLDILMKEEYFENHDHIEDLKIIHNFDVKCVLETTLLKKSKEAFQTRVYWDLGKINLSIDDLRLQKLLDYRSVFAKSQDDLNERFSLLMVSSS